MLYVSRGLGVVILILTAIVLGTIALDSPKPPPQLLSVSGPFEAVDFSDLPPVLPYTARDGAALAYRRYAGVPDLTTTYSYRLLTNFQPDDDWLGDLRRTTHPIMAMDGADDEIFLADRLQAALAAGKPGIRVDIVPGVGHIGLTTTPARTTAIAKAWSSRF